VVVERRSSFGDLNGLINAGAMRVPRLEHIRTVVPEGQESRLVRRFKQERV